MIAPILNTSKNIMTPNIIRTTTLKHNRSIELSKGDNLDKTGTLYGVTVACNRKNELLHDLNKCFHSLDEAELYINNLRGK